jgi:hypothetical protein
MAALPQRLKLGNEVGKQIFAPDTGGDANREACRAQDANGEEIPIFCAGGCGEVVGYFRTRTAANPALGAGEQYCSKCKAGDFLLTPIREAKPPLRAVDEPGAIAQARRNLGWLQLAQVVVVLSIFAGSVLIATGRVAGLYLAAFGTLAWLVVWLTLWWLRG